MLEERYRGAASFATSVDAARHKRDLWVALRKRARVPDELVARVEALGGEWRLLALSEDWCGDAVNTLPPIAALADAARNLELRVLERDRNPDLMDAHLTNGSRSIPVVMVLDADFRERGWWGPRPAELQRWAMGPGQLLEPDDRYRELRRWYARDGGRTTLREIVSVLEGAARQRSAA